MKYMGVYFGQVIDWGVSPTPWHLLPEHSLFIAYFLPSLYISVFQPFSSRGTSGTLMIISAEPKCPK